MRPAINEWRPKYHSAVVPFAVLSNCMFTVFGIINFSLIKARRWFASLTKGGTVLKVQATRQSILGLGHLGRVAYLRVISMNLSLHPDMFLPNLQNVLFWRATRCGFAKNCSKMPKTIVKQSRLGHFCEKPHLVLVVLKSTTSVFGIFEQFVAKNRTFSTFGQCMSDYVINFILVTRGYATQPKWPKPSIDCLVAQTLRTLPRGASEKPLKTTKGQKSVTFF